jgi:MFS family permease
VGRGGLAATRRFRTFAASEGAADTGLARLTELHAVAAAGDAALTVSLAGTAFAMPTDEARGQVALFLLLTMAPFVLLAPLIGPLLDRFRHGRRWALGATLAVRAFLSWVLASALVEQSPWLFPAALGCLVASRTYVVARAAGVPRLVPERITLVKANSRINIAALVGMAIGGGLAGGLAQLGPDWSLRLAFLIYVAATVLAIRLPARVDSTPDLPDEAGLMPDGIGLAPGAADDRPGRAAGSTDRLPRRRVRALPTAVGVVLWLVTGSRVLTGFLVFYLVFLTRENPLPGWSGPLVLGLVVAAAGLGNAAGSFLGNLSRIPHPQILATISAGALLASAVLPALLYSVWTLVVVGLSAGVFAQLGKLALDAIVQSDVEERQRGRVFSWTETILQGFWVLGGAVGIVAPLDPSVGFGIASAVVVGTGLLALRVRLVRRGRPGPVHPAQP